MMRPHKKGMPAAWPALAHILGAHAFGMAAVVAALEPAEAVELRITPRLEVRETYTDNVNLTPTDSVVPGDFRRDDFVTTLSPGLTAEITGARVELRTTYTANYLIFADLGTDDLRHNLISAATVEPVDDFFFIDAQAAITQRFLDREGGFSGSDANLTANRDTTRTFNISPYVTARLGQIATVTARYRFSYLSTDDEGRGAGLANILTDGLIHAATLNVTSGPYFGRVRWTVNGVFERTNREDSLGNVVPDFDQESIVLGVEYALNRTFSFTGSVGYGNTGAIVLTRAGNDLIWDVGVRVSPNRRLNAGLTYGRSEGNRVFNGELTYQWGEKTQVFINYSDNIQTSQGTLAGDLTQIEIGDDGFQEGGFPFDPNPPNLGFDSRISRNKNLRAGLRYSFGRNRLNASGNVLRREFDQAGGESLRYGGSVTLSRDFTPRTSGNLDFRIDKEEFELSDRDDVTTVAQAAIRHALGEMLAGRLTFIRSDRDSNFIGEDIKEIAVTVALEASF